MIPLLLALFAQDEHIDRAYGFRFRRPPDWSVRIDRSNPEVAKAVVVWRKESGITVYVVENPDHYSLEQLRDFSDWKLRQNPACSDIRIESGRVAGRPAYVFRYVYNKKLPVDYRLFERKGLVYGLEAVGKEDDFEVVRNSFALFDAEGDPAARCGSEIEWHRTWDSAAKKARSEGKLVLAIAERYTGFGLGRRLYRWTTFMDPEFVELVRERFVAVEGALPPTLKDYLGPRHYGVSYLFLTPEGKLLRDEAIRNPVALHAVACSLLPKSDETLSDDPRARSRQLRRQRRYAEAFAALPEDAKIERARLLMDLDREAEALPILETLKSTEARFRLALCRLSAGERAKAEADLQALVADRPDDRWAWWAAAYLENRSLFPGGRTPRAWDEDHIRDLLERPAPRTAAVAEARRDAAAWLATHQRANGAWTVPFEFEGPDPAFPLAVTAIAARAVPSDRALDYVLKNYRWLLGAGDRAGIMSYEVWAEPFVLRLFADCLRRKTGDAAKIRVAAEEFVEDLAKRRRPVGGWTYLLRMDPASGGVADVAMSFVTASVLIALVDARDAGVRVPEEMIAKAADVLVSLRSKGGFAYFTGSAVQGDLDPEAAARGPACVLALVRAKRAGPAELRRALEVFESQRAAIKAERGKSMMHAGPQGQGCHFIWFDTMFAAEAAAELKLDVPWLVEDVLEARLADGGFAADFPATGRAYATAAALTALR